MIGNLRIEPSEYKPMTTRPSGERLSASQGRVFSLSEVQTLLGISRSTVWRWCSERGLRVITVGRVKRILESDLQTFLARETKRSGHPNQHTITGCDLV